MLQINDLVGGWDQTTIVEKVSLTLNRGDCLAVMGRNGVGKTTLLELVAGRAHYASGGITMDGIDICGISTYHRAQLGLGYVPQTREVFPSLTVREHLKIAARSGRWTLANVLELLPRLGQRLDSLASTLSGGEQQMLAIARALIGNPWLILMDEPSEGLAPLVVEQLANVLKAIIADGSLAMLLVEQRVEIALALSNHYAIMDRGRIVHNGRSATAREGGIDLPELMGLGH